MKKSAFIFPKDQIYLCGHSLGPATYAAQNKINESLQEWISQGVSGWNTSRWMELSYDISSKIAKLIGAKFNEVCVGDSTSVNLFKVLYSAYSLNSQRKIILTDQENFPTDLYIAQGLRQINPKLSLHCVPPEAMLEAMNEHVGVLLLTHVNYRSGAIYDMASIMQRAQALGIRVIWDLSHSTGIVPIDLGAYEVDFAVGCTYKYLNGGPGAPSYIYINQKHHPHVHSPITGWMGHQDPFAFEKAYRPAQHAAKYLVGTPYIFSLAALEGALNVYKDLDITLVRQKSMRLSETFRKIMMQQVPSLECQSPLDPQRRGGHIAYGHPQAYAISRALIAKGVICDYREHGLLRFCLNPLYISLTEIKESSNIIGEILRHELYRLPVYHEKRRVT